MASGSTNRETSPPASVLRSMRNRQIWALMLGELLLFAVAGHLSFRLVAEARASRAWVEHSHEVLHALADLRLTVARLSAWTLYFVNGDESITASRIRGELGRVQGKLDALRGLVADDPAQRERVLKITEPLGPRLDLHRHLVDRVAPGDMAAAQPIVRALGRGADPVRASFAELATSERDKLAARNAASEATMQRLLVLLLAVFAAALLFGVLATLQFLYRLRLQNTRWRELAQANAEIARQHEAVRRTTRRLDAVLDNAHDVIMLVSGDLKVVMANEASAALLGASSGDVVGRSITEFLPSFEAAEGRIWLQQALRADGTEFSAEISVGGCQLEDGPAFVCIIRDVTERQKLEQLKDDFVSTVSHELRTPLTSIRGSVGLVASGAAGDLPVKARDLIEIAHKNSQQLIELVNDLLDIQKLDADRAGSGRERVDVRRLVGSVVDACRELARQAQVEMSIEDGSGRPIDVAGEFGRLQQVLINLVSNAIKFSDQGGRVVLSIAGDETHAVLAVRDFGPGIPDEFRPRIFGRFARAETGDARRTRGTGLGLSIVKAIVERHDGEVGFDSPLPDGGSRFWLRLPLQAAAAQPADDRSSFAVGEHPIVVPT